MDAIMVLLVDFSDADTTELDQYTTAPAVTATTSNAVTTVTVTGGATQATDYVFNNTGQQTDVKDATTGADWNTGYNLLGQAVSNNDPDAGNSTMAYDPAGNLTQSTNAAGKTVSYTYDALNRKTGAYDAPVAAQSSANQLASWVYDNANNAVSAMTYPIGQLTTETAYIGGSAYTTQQSGFNVYGESLGLSITIPPSEGKLADTYTYTSTYTPGLGLPSSTTLPAAGNLTGEKVNIGYCPYNGLVLPCTLGSLGSTYTHNIVYTATGQVAEQDFTAATNGLFNTYDPHTTALADEYVKNTTVSATPIDDTAYTYDPAGNPTRQTETRQGTQAETQCHQYDGLDRLTQAWTATDTCATTPTAGSHAMVGDGITGGAYWTSYSLDSLGQRKTETDHSLTTGTADTTTTYTYGGSAPGCTTTSSGLHTLAYTSTTGPSGTSSNTYCYDSLGNTTQRNTTAQGQQTLTWNDQGQLTAVTTASAGSSYLYTPEGNLLEQKDPGTTTLYLPGQQLALNTTTNTVTATRFYTLPGGGQAVRTGTGTNYSFELTDQHNTSTLTLSNTLTNPVWRQQTPYGAPRGTTPTTWPDNHGFLNKPQDTTTGLTDIGARWYDPTLGRFTSLDPLFEATSPQQQNGYTYAAANPITGSDPTGLCRYRDDDVCLDPGGSASDKQSAAGGSGQDVGQSQTDNACPANWTQANGTCKNPLDSVTYKKQDNSKGIEGGIYIAGMYVPSPSEMNALGFRSGDYTQQIAAWAQNKCGSSNAPSSVDFCTAATRLGLVHGEPDPFGIFYSVRCLATGQDCGKAAEDLALGCV
jgi:RHS repeat-associated protein